ncbi:MAG: NAD-dependent epimerase/dehydratase family protein [Bacteroidota bacterium]
MTALVTGASGFIGSHLVEHLLQKNIAVRVLLRKTSSRTWLKDLQIEEVVGDLFSGEVLREAVQGVDYIYHSAGLTKAKTSQEYYRANAEGTKNLLAAALEQTPGLKRFVLVSSQTAAGPSHSKTPITEGDSPHPITTYGKSKLQAEAECLDVAARLPVTIVRPPAVFGPRDKDIFEFFNTFNKGLQPIVGFSEKYVSLVHVRDLVRGTVMAGESDTSRGETYFISSRDVYGWKEVGEITRRVMGKNALRLRIPEFGVYAISAVAEFFSLFSSKPALINLEKARDMVQDYWTCDSSKAKRDFGYEQEIDLEEGIRDTVQWYREHNWLR